MTYPTNLSANSQMRIHYSIVFVSDMRRSVAFYRDLIGLTLKFESPGWSEFATDGAALALHQSRSQGSEAGGGSGEEPGHCRFGLQVPDLDVFHDRMTSMDVECRQAPTETFGSRVAQYVDPDGLVFSVGEARKHGT